MVLRRMACGALLWGRWGREGTVGTAVRGCLLRMATGPLPQACRPRTRSPPSRILREAARGAIKVILTQVSRVWITVSNGDEQTCGL